MLQFRSCSFLFFNPRSFVFIPISHPIYKYIYMDDGIWMICKKERRKDKKGNEENIQRLINIRRKKDQCRKLLTILSWPIGREDMDGGF